MSKWSIEDIAHKTESEGLGYMVTDYINPDNIEDEELKALWKEARTALAKIEKILAPHML